MGRRFNSFRAGCLSTFSGESSARRWYAGRRQGSVRLVIPHGVRPRRGLDAAAGSDGTTNAGDDAEHGRRNAADAFVVNRIVVDRNNDWTGGADTYGKHVGSSRSPRDTVF